LLAARGTGILTSSLFIQSPEFSLGKSPVLAVPNVTVPLLPLKPAVQSLNMKRLITILAAITVATFASAQSSVTGSVFSKTLMSFTDSSPFAGSENVLINFAGLAEEYRPDAYTGAYSLSVTFTLAGANYSATDPQLAALYTTSGSGSPVSLGSSTFTADGGTSTLISNSVTFASAYSGSSVIINYGSILLDAGEQLPISAVYTLTAVPEPSTYALFLGVGTLGLVGWRRFRRK